MTTSERVTLRNKEGSRRKTHRPRGEMALGGPVRTKEQKALDMEIIKDYLLRGIRNPRRIAAEMNAMPDRPYSFSHMTVQYDIQNLTRQVMEKCKEDLEAHRMRLLAENQELKHHIYDDLWKSMEKKTKKSSKAVKKNKVGFNKEQDTGEDLPDLIEQKLEETEGCGNPAYYRLIMKAMDQEADLRGLKQIQVNVTAKEGSIVILPSNQREKQDTFDEAKLKSMIEKAIKNEEGN